MWKTRIDSCFSGAAAASALLSLAAPAAQAASITTTFQVTATVLASCGVTATDLNFGNYTPGAGSDVTANTTLNVTCTNGTDYTIALDGGSIAHDPSARAMSAGGSDMLNYGLYADASFTTVWGDGGGATATVSGTGNGAAQPTTIYGRIPAGQYVPATTYTDQITVEVTY
jgi:spore coat protein U-like protein